MTKQELNRDIKRLAGFVRSLDNINEMPEKSEKYIKDEIRRLYYADDKFEYMSKESVLRLLRMNLRFRSVALHHFGLRMDI